MNASEAKVCNKCYWVYAQPICPRCHEDNATNIIDLLRLKPMKDEGQCQPVKREL